MSGSLFFGLTAGAQKAIKDIKDVEMGVTEIARVMEDSRFVFDEYRNELLDFGVSYGQAEFGNVQDIASRWAQAGYNVEDSLKATETSLLALNTAELDAKASTEDLVGIMAQWQLEINDLPLLLDQVNKTADDFTVTSQDLVDGLLRSSGASKIMGLSIEQTISLLTVMREASGRTGREVGNALNSILSYVQRPVAIKAFEDNGIQVFADNARTQFRNVMNIFQDVAAKWPTLSASIQDGFVKAADDAGLYNEELANAIGTQEQWNDIQQRDLSQAAAGVYRRNYFIGMIERLSGAQEVLNNMTDAAGYSQSENERTMNTLEKKYQSMQAYATKLAVAMGDSGMTGVLKGITGAGINVLEFLNNMDPNMRNFIILWTELTIAVKASQAALKLFGITLPVITSLTTGLTGLQAAVTTLSASVKGFFVTNWPLLAATAVAAGIFAVVSAVRKAEEEQKRFIDTTKENISSLSEQKSRLQQLSNEYETLKRREQNLSATAEEKKRLLDVQKELVSQYGVSITGINAEGQAYSDSTEAIKLRTKALEDEISAEKAKLEIAVKSRDVDDVKNLEDNISKRVELASQLLEKQKEVDKYELILQNKGKMTVSGGGRVATIDANTEYGANIIRQYIQNASNEQSAIQSSLNKVNEAIQSGTANRQQLLQNDANSIIKQLQDNGIKVSDSAKAFATEFAKTLALQPKDIQSQRNALKEFIDQINDSNFDEAVTKYNDFKAKGDSSGIDETSKTILDLVHTFAYGKPELDNFVLTMESVFGNSSTIKKTANDSIPDFRQGIQSLSEAFSDNKSEIYGLNNEIKNINQTINELNDGNSISADKMNELLVSYPELKNAIHETAKGYTIEVSALESLKKARIEEQTEALKAQLGITNSATTGLSQRLKIYGIEISAIKTLNDARTEALKIQSPPDSLKGVIPDSVFKNADELKNSLYDYG